MTAGRCEHDRLVDLCRVCTPPLNRDEVVRRARESLLRRRAQIERAIEALDAVMDPDEPEGIPTRPLGIESLGDAAIREDAGSSERGVVRAPAGVRNISQPRRRGRGWDDDRRREVVAYAIENGVTSACEHFGLGQSTVFRWRLRFTETAPISPIREDPEEPRIGAPSEPFMVTVELGEVYVPPRKPRRSKHSAEDIRAVLDYADEHGSERAAAYFHVGRRSIVTWRRELNRPAPSVLRAGNAKKGIDHAEAVAYMHTHGKAAASEHYHVATTTLYAWRRELEAQGIVSRPAKLAVVESGSKSGDSSNVVEKPAKPQVKKHSDAEWRKTQTSQSEAAIRGAQRTDTERAEIVNYAARHGISRACKHFNVTPQAVYNWRKAVRESMPKRENSPVPFLRTSDHLERMAEFALPPEKVAQPATTEKVSCPSCKWRDTVAVPGGLSEAERALVVHRAVGDHIRDSPRCLVLERREADA